MNWVDAAVVAVIVFSALLAFMRGFVREVLGIGAWVGAALLAVWGGPYLLPRFREWISDPNLSYAAAYLAVFVGALILLSIMAGLVGGVVQGSLLGGLDRTLGVIFGLLRGAVLVGLAYIGLGLVAEPASWPVPLLHARCLPLAYDDAVLLVSVLPPAHRPAVPPPPGQSQARADDFMQPQPQGRAIGKP